MTTMTTASTTSKRTNENDKMDEKYEIWAQMFKMRAIMWCFHSSLHANLLYDLFASKYLFTLSAAIFSSSWLPLLLSSALRLPPLFRPFSLLSFRIEFSTCLIEYGYLSWVFSRVCVCVVLWCAVRQAQFSYNVFHIHMIMSKLAYAIERDFMRKILSLSHCVIDTCILNTNAYT